MSRFALARTHKTDPKLEQDGIWIPNGETDDGRPIAFRVRRSGGANKAYEKGVRDAFKPHTALINAGIANNDALEKVLVKVFANTVLVGWENVDDAEGKAIPFSKEAALEMLTELPDLYKQLMSASGQMALFRSESLKADAGN